jgi:hypothetical protein
LRAPAAAAPARKVATAARRWRACRQHSCSATERGLAAMMSIYNIGSTNSARPIARRGRARDGEGYRGHFGSLGVQE